MYSLKSFIAITPSLVDFTIDYLKGLTKKDPIHDIYYKTAMIAILDHIETKEGDYELALGVSNTSTELALDSFESWYNLARCHIKKRGPLNGTCKHYDLTAMEFTNLSGTLRNWKEDELKRQVFGRIAMINEKNRLLRNLG
ncbi:CRE_collapsed_G0028540.mRNA.1.CDS.1 [Saccharomyces cerevisiae]|nr:CRE_collapsed_G0028540.mRNA.1.CDS.1 [Saccharomyces cerevisiae]